MNGSRRTGGLCENAVIEYGEAMNKHFPDRREIKTLIWCENVAEYKVTGQNIRRVSYYCGSCVEGMDSRRVEKIEKEEGS